MTPPEEFPFPFPPYEIQKDFMKCLYLCLNNGNLGIFESPTGTGKSMSIICGAFKWLLDHELQYKNSLTDQLSDLNEKLNEITEKTKGDWFAEQTAKIKVTTEKQALQSKLDVLQRREERLDKFKEKIALEKITKKKRYWKSKKNEDADKSIKKKDVDNVENRISPERESDFDTDLILEEFNLDSDPEAEEEALEEVQITKIFFCSRTHSQLTQFIGEVKKSPYVSQVSLVPLSSRQNYCINQDVLKLNNISLINDRCLQMQKKKTSLKEEKDLKRKKVATTCPFNPGNQSLLIADIVTSVQDVEEIAESAKISNTCAYYASRRSLSHIQIVLVPYNIILHRNTRISSGINIKNNILIVDEAHNLLEAIENMHSAIITGRHILHCFNQLSQYQKRFENLLSPKNVLYLGQLSFILKKLIRLFGGTIRSQHKDKIEKPGNSAIYTIEKFEILTEIDTINIFHLLQFINTSKLIHKLRGYVEKYSGDLKILRKTAKPSGVSAFLNTLQNKEEAVNKEQVETNSEDVPSSPLMFITSFLECLKNNSADGRIFINPGLTIGQGTVKFLLMNPAAHFHEIVMEAKSVVLAGGTMEPMAEFRDQLFISAGAAPERIVTYSCDHVIPEENILTRIVTCGPSGKIFEFNYKNRENEELLNELGSTLINLCNIVPGGIVVFFPSYNYEVTLYKHLTNSGILKKIQNKKQVFREPKLTSEVNTTLQNYSEVIRNPKSPQTGAIIFSVVGGKLSEGLNFSDDLGRCVIVVGMPYPNIKSPELQEKMKYLNENVRQNAGNEYYENTCMKAVNQCIGRAVRHINDFSTVVLLDKRYSNKSKALPGWIQRSLMVNDSFSNMIADVAKFFRNKKNKQVYK